MDACTASSGRYCRPWSRENLGLSPHCASTNWVTLGKLFYISLSFFVCKMVMLIVASPWSCGENVFNPLVQRLAHRKSSTKVTTVIRMNHVNGNVEKEATWQGVLEKRKINLLR